MHLAILFITLIMWFGKFIKMIVDFKTLQFEIKAKQDGFLADLGNKLGDYINKICRNLSGPYSRPLWAAGLPSSYTPLPPFKNHY